jgi:hypothetical protein
VIIRSECEEEIISFLNIENNLCPFWRGESIQFYPHHALVDEFCNVSLESDDTFVFLPTEVRMSDRDNSAHISDDATRLFGGWFIFWYFDGAYRIFAFSFETFTEKLDTIWLVSLLITIRPLDGIWSAVHVTREMRVIETLRIVSFGTCPVL